MEQEKIESLEQENTKSQFKFTKFTFFIILILIIAGLVVCADLNYIFYKTNWTDNLASSWCSVSDLIDCDGVAKTQYSLSFGVPNSIWGTLLYLVMLMLLFVDRIQAKWKNTIFDVFKNPASYIASLALLSFAISMVLAYISIVVINKICALCFITYAIDLLIALFALNVHLYIKDTIVDFIDGAKKHFVLFIIVLVGFVGTVYYLDKNNIFLSPKLKKEREFKEFYEAKTNKYAVKGNILGHEDAKVNIVVYSDYNCPFCRVLNIMLHKIVKENKYSVRIEEKSYPLDNSCNFNVGMTLGGHETSCFGSRLALAAKKQDKFWGVANILFDMQRAERKVDEQYILDSIKNAHLGLDMDKLVQDANSEEIINELQNEISEASSRGIMGTPAIDIDGVLYMGSGPYEVLKERIELAQKRENN